MALSIGEKARRMLTFILGLAAPRVRRRLARHGFDDDELARGIGLLNAMTTARLGVAPPLLDEKLLAEIDAFENEWFPILEVVLRTNYPAVHAIVFRNLTQSEGPEVVVSVKTLLDRVEAVAQPEDAGGHPEGPAARALLVKRGFDETVVSEGRALLARVGTVPEGAELIQSPDPEAVAAAEEAMWKWYLEWGGIARNVIRDRRSLRALGFLRTRRRPDGTEEDVLVNDDDIEDDTTGNDDPTADDDVTGEDLVTGPTPKPEPTS